MPKKFHHKHALAAILCMLFNSSFASDDLTSSDVHGEITREALNGTVCPANIEVMVNGSKSQDLSDAASEQPRHFETKDVNRSYEYVKREQKKVLNYAHDADSNADSRVRALYHFGMMLHTVQDFYSNTNYLKLKVEELDRTKGGAFDPYSIELFDWVKLGNAKTVIVGGNELRVETARNARLELSLQDSTYGKVARGLAIRETSRQWSYLENLLNSKYGERAKTILIALKQASCIKKYPPEAEDSLNDND